MNLWPTWQIIARQIAALLPGPRYCTSVHLHMDDAGEAVVRANVQVYDAVGHVKAEGDFTEFDCHQMENPGHAERWGTIIAHAMEKQLKEQRNAPV